MEAGDGDEPVHFKGDDLPVETVSWDDCREFSKKTKLSLPTKVQWAPRKLNFLKVQLWSIDLGLQ